MPNRSDRRKPILKYLRYAAVVLIILAILAAVIHFYRESIARGFANSVLHKQGITATELSIQTLGIDYVRLSYLVLEQDDGTRYEVSGLSFPLSFPSVRSETISIEQLVLTPAAAEAAPTPLARLLQSFLQLPGNVPNTEITVSRFTMPDAPPVDNIVWRFVGQRQHLAFSIDSIDVTIDVDGVDNGDHHAMVRAAVFGTTDALSLALTMHRSNTGFSINGMSTINLSQWLPVLKSIGWLPDDIVSLGDEIDGQVTIVLYDDVTRPVTVNAHISLAGEMSTEYRAADDSSVRLRADISGPVGFSFEYPSLEWTASVGQIDMLVGVNRIGNITVRLSDLECSSGIQCAVRASLDTGPLELEAITLGNAKLSTSLAFAGGETTRVDISPDFALALSGIESQSFSVASISVTQFSGAQLTIDDGGWRGDINHLELAFDSLTDRESLIASLPITFNTLHISDGGAAIDAEVSIPPNAASISWDSTGIVVPRIEGHVSLEDDRVVASLVLTDNEGAVTASVDVSHDLATGEGSIAVTDATLQFGQRKLSGHFLEWSHAWDIVAGSWTTDIEMDWYTGNDPITYSGTMAHRARVLAGNYNDYVFSGLNTTLTGNLDSATGVTLLPSSIELELFDVGLPLKQITADFELDIEQQALGVQNLSMSVLGGKLLVDPFRFDLREERNDLVLRPQSIQLQFMAELAELESIELSGSLSGTLPITIHNDVITIANGRLENDPPGGVIRYLPGVATEDVGNSDSGIGLVSRALANFQFDSLTSDVNYTENGDLMLQMKLTGVNPDMDANQPVILNLGVENNIPQLLRSLRATRSIEEILERMTRNQAR